MWNQLWDPKDIRRKLYKKRGRKTRNWDLYFLSWYLGIELDLYPDPDKDMGVDINPDPDKYMGVDINIE